MGKNGDGPQSNENLWAIQAQAQPAARNTARSPPEPPEAKTSHWCMCCGPRGRSDEPGSRAAAAARGKSFPDGSLRMQGHRPEECRADGKDPYVERRQRLPAEWRRRLQMFLSEQEWLRLTQLQERVADLAQGANAKFCLRMDEVMLLRYLRARKGSVEDAERQLRATLEWEQKYDALNCLRTWDPALHLAIRPFWKPFGCLGRDNDGDPIIWERLGNADAAGVAQIPEIFLLRDEVFRRETLYGILDEIHEDDGRPFPMFTVVEDLTGLSLKHVQMFPLWHRLIKTYEDHCPELIKRIILLNAPPIFPVAWNMFQRTLDENQRRKYSIPSKEKQLACLLEHMPASSIPAYLGGQAATHGDPECREVICPGGTIPGDLIDKLSTWNK